jgi:hypothetical protein
MEMPCDLSDNDCAWEIFDVASSLDIVLDRYIIIRQLLDSLFNILCPVDPLLCNDREMGEQPGPFMDSGSVNTFPLLGSRFLIMQ